MATAAGLLVGVVVGQFVRVGSDPAPTLSTAASQSSSGERSAPPPFIAAASKSPAPTAASPVSDDEFMLELELSLSSPQIWELRALDAITPRTREVAINVR